MVDVHAVRPGESVTVGELEHRAFGDTDLRGRNPGMVRWGYVSLGPDPRDTRPKPQVRDWLVRPTAAGQRAQAIWRRLPAATEECWGVRFGADTTAALRRSLTTLVDQLDVELPDYLPLNAAHGGAELAVRPRSATAGSCLDLSALLAKVLLVFTLDFERDSPLSLVLSANPVRALGPGPRPVRDLPAVTGVATETLHVMLDFLARAGRLVQDRQGARTAARLAASGLDAYRTSTERVDLVENQWRSRFGSAAVADLRKVLDVVVADPVSARSPLAAGIAPPEGGWRSRVARPEMLPHHPVVSHRGGYPDGS